MQITITTAKLPSCRVRLILFLTISPPILGANMTCIPIILVTFRIPASVISPGCRVSLLRGIPTTFPTVMTKCVRPPGDQTTSPWVLQECLCPFSLHPRLKNQENPENQDLQNMMVSYLCK